MIKHWAKKGFNYLWDIIKNGDIKKDLISNALKGAAQARFLMDYHKIKNALGHMLGFRDEPQQVPFMSQTFTIPVSGNVKVLNKLKFRDIIAILNKDFNTNQVERSMEYWKAKLNSFFRDTHFNK